MSTRHYWQSCEKSWSVPHRVFVLKICPLIHVHRWEVAMLYLLVSFGCTAAWWHQQPWSEYLNLWKNSVPVRENLNPVSGTWIKRSNKTPSVSWFRSAEAAAADLNWGLMPWGAPWYSTGSTDPQWVKLTEGVSVPTLWVLGFLGFLKFAFCLWLVHAWKAPHSETLPCLVHRLSHWTLLPKPPSLGGTEMGERKGSEQTQEGTAQKGPEHVPRQLTGDTDLSHAAFSWATKLC